MSLIVYAYRIDPTTNKGLNINEKPKEPFNDLFGFESWRKTVWNAPILQKLGCRLLNSLAFEDIYAQGKELVQLKSELELVKENSITIAATLHLDQKSLEFRVGNALEAIRIAQNVENGIVYIG